MFTQFLVEAMHRAQGNPGGKTPELILKDVTKALDYNDIKVFVQVNQHKYVVCGPLTLYININM